MRRYENFSDHDFELFVADLLGVDEDRRYETFPRGRDFGVDLRYLPRSRKRPHVVQCKHYSRSAHRQLLAAAKKEAKRLAELRARFASYRFVTSRQVSARQKSELANALSPWIQSDADILGAHDLEGLLDRHPDVERRQVKLWLTGGTQLAALLHAGVIHRSQTLLDQIEASMPRYVQGEAFLEARERLRAHRVLVIAGVPGIGKTTLARILLADAVLDGYEPIEVSNDIEEAWELLDDRAKQIFLYDDFLGRTALGERFAKNEDRRLLDFMARAARRASTLFVLTTREYILRQAAVLYERIEQAGIEGQRFLLELPSYSRLDRARIFANHAYHSPSLDVRAKRSLLDNNAYERIIDHPNYNPRIIEWITGMGGRTLHAEQLDDYVSLAVDALDHPERIWKHAFEHEIDNHGRALLLTLTTVPRRIDIEHAERAFESFCRLRGFSLAERAFRRTLAALDDSMIRTLQGDARYLQPRELLVEPHDPSIVDFIRDYLRESHADFVDLAASAVYFEQVEWLWDVAAGKRRLSQETVKTLVDALERTFGAPGLRPVTVPVSSHAYTTRPRGTADLEDRLMKVLELSARAGAERERLSVWWRERFEERVAAWRRDEGEPPSLLALLNAMPVEAIDAATVDAAKRALQAGWAYVQNVEWLAELRDAFQAAFGQEDWGDIVDAFAEWVTNDLTTSAQDMTDSEELAFVERVADRIGIQIDEDELDYARDIVRENETERDSQVEPDEDWEPDRGRASSAAESREVEAIFSRLADVE